MSITFPYTLTGSNGALQWPKIDLQPIPGGANLTQYMSSSDWNAAMESLVELALGTTSGTLFGFQRQASSPNSSAGPNGAFSDYVYVNAQGQIVQHLRGNTEQSLLTSLSPVVSQSFQFQAGNGLQGTGALTGSVLVVSLTPSGTAGTYTNATVVVDAFGRITSASNGAGGGGGLSYVPSLSASYVASSATSGNVLPLSTGQGPFALNVAVPNYSSPTFQILSGASTFLQVDASGNVILNSVQQPGSGKQLNLQSSGSSYFGIKWDGSQTTLQNAGGNLNIYDQNSNGIVITGNEIFLKCDNVGNVIHIGQVGSNQGINPQSDNTYFNGVVNQAWAWTYSRKYYGAGPSPSGTLAGGAGTGASYTFSGSDSGHLLSLNVGSTPNPNDVAITGTFAVQYVTSGNIVMSPANAAAAAAMSAAYIDSNYVYNHGGASYAIKVNGSALTPSTTFKWWVAVIG